MVSLEWLALLFGWLGMIVVIYTHSDDVNIGGDTRAYGCTRTWLPIDYPDSTRLASVTRMTNEETMEVGARRCELAALPVVVPLPVILEISFGPRV